jgi:hypothetical protein
MRRQQRLVTMIQWIAVVMTFVPSLTAAQNPHPNPPATTEQMSQKDVADMQDQLLQLLRVTPTLAEVISRDPSLLGNADYVNRYNPSLGHFLETHPQIAQNPDFYLFNNLHGQNEQPSETLERKLWPEVARRQQEEPQNRVFIEYGVPFLVFLCMLGALLWLIHVLLENRRWNRIFKLQSDVHGKLIERFATSQEVLTYMSTEAGKRFLEATPIAVGFERSQPFPSPVARVLTPMQIGIVMVMLGIGLISLRPAIPDAAGPLLALGTVVLMPGLGFIISAGITWWMSRHFGLMQDPGTHTGNN